MLPVVLNILGLSPPGANDAVSRGPRRHKGERVMLSNCSLLPSIIGTPFTGSLVGTQTLPQAN